ncbi:hypothetical protein Pst134EA_017106 [Puccinia striiformis f. sp. tritici]|uniref:Uncharacterized protein n=1 Tax=Puccinia striiformis f. sp. tritici PST-78 TaxID=1165861 RepID=A0A0L0UTG4_9BASI|nr:hypothetical protein Pst134EA_017106 [Puccinia striiformis f. sp. tritici]KAI9622301.1 hypothetical protein H4Q26_015339 [Puccinia striiformis f. sp. tritici PST-130]KNE90337.1 hypothetical protein PSTG_16209 [Puccinia striiformis f. sp. tritici PST-78]KAH9450468.1 hypothetical protein Pst134EB_018005 [Puccinia striiformis f. sp. tritici]KAH9460789.1 hypothetical protein Pst134EA_017106 [Puccinia striiformis f. sp. tritici]KNE90338.1 hypothetical protein, variant [Puccinia striiformis f. sp
MSDPARYPNYRYPPRGYPPPSHPATRLRPAYYYSPAAGIPNPAPLNDPTINPTSTYAPEDHHHPNYTPGMGPWSNLPPPGAYDYEYWPHPPPHMHYPNLPVGIDPFSRMEQFANPMDHHHKRLKWREEILKGDPDKLISESVAEASRLVVSIVTRGPVDQPYGQGQEVLCFRSLRKPSHYATAQDNVAFTCFALDACSIAPLKEGDPVPSAIDLSKKSLTALMPKLDVGKDLKLVRKSKPLLWDNTTIIEAYLYRVVEGKEDPGSAGGRDLEERLGPETHLWNPITDYPEFLATIQSDIIATAIVSVYLPPYLSNGLDRILADQDSRADGLSLEALNVLYHCVTSQFARTAFPHYPIPPPPGDQKDYEVCEKRRVWAYWTEVMAWHLSQLREDVQVSTSYTLLKSLYAVKASVDDGKVSLDELERIMINAIASEADRSRHATETLVHEGIGECLHNPNFAPPENALEKMHIVTAGTSSVVYNVIAKLITHVLARKPSLTESSSKSTINRRIMDLKITIAESRPLSEGVTLAMKLSHVVETYLEYRDRGSKHAKQASAAPSIADLGSSVLDPNLQARMKQEMSEAERKRSLHRLQPVSLGLSKLLDDLDAKKEKKEPKVSIELITDAAVVSTVMAAGGTNVKPIILLGADRIFADGKVVNKVGSAQMAWAGKCSGGVVLILCRADRVHSKDMPGPAKASSPSDELVSGWEHTIGLEAIADLQKSSHVKISNPTYEDVNYEDITGYITELGFMGRDMLMEFSNMRSDLEKVVWPENALSK